MPRDSSKKRDFRQEISFSAWTDSDLAERLNAVFDQPQIQKLIDGLKQTRNTGRPGYPVAVMVKTILAGFILNIPTDTGVIRALRDNPLLSHLCGISHPDEIPSPWAYSRFRKKLIAHRELVLECVAELVEELGERIPGFGEIVAIDSTDMHAYSNGAGKPKSDPDASWSAKRGRNGKPRYWFGFKGHMMADARTDIPMWIQVTTASTHDGQNSLPLLQAAKEKLKRFEPQYVLADRGYDAQYVHKSVVEDLGAVPIILMRHYRDPSEPWGERYDQIGTPVCDQAEPMQFWGYEAKRGTTKWRCSRRAQGRFCECSESEYGQVVRVKLREDYRRHCAVPRSTKRWWRLYNKRGSVERAFSRLKEYRKLNNLKIRGLPKVELHAMLAVIIMQAVALAATTN